MAVTQRFSANPYRILRLSGEAPSREIHKAASQVRRMMSLGVEAPDSDADQLGPCTRTEATIRMAIGQLENPVERLEHRLFWHLPVAADVPDDYQDVKARHEACIAHLIAASAVETTPEATTDRATEAAPESAQAAAPAFGLEAEPLTTPARLAQALAGWRALVADDRFWELMQTIEMGGDFEPAAFPSEIDALRKSAMRMAAEPFVEGMRDALLQGKSDVVAPWLAALAGLSQEDWATDLAEEAGEQLLKSLENRCTQIIESLAQELVRENDYVKGNTVVANAALNRYRTEAATELNRLLPLIAGVPALDARAREAAANCLAQVAGAYTWCDDFERAEKLFSEALSLSRGTMAELGLERGMEGIAQSAKARRRWGKKVDGAPALFTLNGCGVTLYGSDAYDAESGTSVATYYFVLVFLPVLPLARYRIRRNGNSYQFYGKLPLRTFDKWHFGIVAAVIAGLFLLGIFAGGSGSSDQVSSNSVSGQDVPEKTHYTAEEIEAEESAEAAEASIAATLPPLPIYISTNELKDKIDAGRVEINALEVKLKPVSDKIKTLDDEMAPMATELDGLDKAKATGQKIDKAHYRQVIDAYNHDVEVRQALIATVQTEADQYDRLLADDHRMVKIYNERVQ